MAISQNIGIPITALFAVAARLGRYSLHLGIPAFGIISIAAIAAIGARET